MNSLPESPRVPGPAPPPPGQEAALLLALGAGYYALAVMAMGLPTQAGAPVFVWPADGLALGALLVASRSLWVPFAGITFLASLVAGLQAGVALEHGSATALLNALEPVLMAVALQRIAGGRVDIGSLQGLTAFLVNLVPLAAAFSLVEAAAWAWRFGGEFRALWTVCFVSDFLNMAVMAPVVIAWGRGGMEAAVDSVRGRVAELIVLYAGLVLTTHLVFRVAAGAVGPLFYLCTPFLIWAALRYGMRAATLGIVAFVLIAYWHTTNGRGPFAMPLSGDWTALLQLHGFAAATVVTTLFAAALLAERETAAQAS